MATEFQRGDAGFGLADQIESLKPSGQRKPCGLHDRAGRKGSLMAAVAALITFEPPAMNKPMLMAVAAGTTKPIRPANLLQSSLTLLFSAVKPHELRQGEAFLELDRTARHDLSGICVPVYAASSPRAEPAG